jgi:NAD(P)-dependent dehydrogenase (short-subunit alcohol dehydrogenase family)
LRVWITGASEGIGRATALAFAREGASVAICARRPEPLQSARLAILEAGAPTVHATAADVGQLADVRRFASEAQAALGGCDVLIHNAASGGPGQLFELNDSDFEADFASACAVNLLAPARLARLAADALSDGGGVIVHVSSAWSRQVMDITPASYGATKAGLNHLTVTLARDLGPRGVRVVGLAPGPIWTETWERNLAREAAASGEPLEAARARLSAEAGGDTSLGRTGEMDEIARTIVWLASDAASYINGTTITADGGYVKAP